MDLSVQKREKLGKAVKSLRRDGLIPAELYGHGIGNLHLSATAKDFKKIFREAGTNTVINLALNGEKHPVLIHDVSTDYISGDVVHVDFYQVRMDEKIKAKVPIELIGISPAVKDKGGILNKNISEVEVEALPADLPHKLEADISALIEFGQSIYMRDIKIPARVEVAVDMNTPVASVSEPRKEEVVEVAPVVPSVEDVKVEGEEKRVAREKEKEQEENQST